MPFTAGLPVVFALLLDSFGNRFFIRDLRLTDVRLNFEFTTQTIEENFWMKFAHAGDNRLLRLFVGSDIRKVGSS